MGALAKLLLVSFLAVASANHQTYPGSSTRPILSASEANHLTIKTYLQGWAAEDIKIPSKPDYIVGSGGYSDIQAAVNAAIKAGGSTRKYIEIKPGTYKQTVFITGNVPITLYGSGSSRSAVKIALHQPAAMEKSKWIAQVNPNGSRYKSGDPAYSIYNNCASGSGTIGTTCSAVVVIKSPGAQLYNLDVQNSNGDVSDGQAVAVKVEADQVRLSSVGLISRQDTFYAGSSGNNQERMFIDNSEIIGDVDFIFGGGTAIFNKCVIRAVSDRHPSGGNIFAPSTDPNKKYGFLVTYSVITGDAGYKSSKRVSLARDWDSAPYVPGTSANGQLLIRSTTIDAIINTSAPYATSTGSRAFKGNANTNRNINDNNYNRFWEYENTGDGA